MSIIASKVARVKLGTIEFEGLLFEDGAFGVAIPQLERLNLVPPNRSLKQLEALLGIGFPSHVKTKNELNSKAVNAINLIDFERALRALDRKGNKTAQSMSDALIGLALTQLFSDSFGIKFEADDRQKWLSARMAGKVSRRTLTDAVKDWYKRNPEGTTRPIGSMIAQTTNSIYRALWEMDAVQIEAQLGCDRNESRNHLSEACLSVLDKAEYRVMEFIDDDNIKPVDAVLAANLKKAKPQIV